MDTLSEEVIHESSNAIWVKSQLCEIAPFVYGKGLPAGKRVDGEIPVYGSNGIVGSHNEALVSEPVIVIGRKGSVGEVHLTSGPSWPIDTTFYVKSSNKVDLDFLFYLFQTLPLKTNSDSAVPGLSREYAHSLEVRVPSVAMQTAIGKVLKSIDFKIAKNSTLCENLEKIAQTIFKSWFVDFDPVKTKMAGEKPFGMDDATAALFPDSMEETDSGLIPKGWKYSLIENFAHVHYGAPFASKLFNDIGDGMPLIRIRDLKTQRIATWSAEKHTKGFTVNGGQLLIGMDGEFNPTLWRGEEALVNQRICLVENKPGVSSLFLYFSLIPILKRIENGAIGTTVIHLGKGDIDEICLLNPGTELLNIFEGLMKELLQKMVILDSQSRNLLAIRDSLLPRLISGELQISEEMLVS